MDDLARLAGALVALLSLFGIERGARTGSILTVMRYGFYLVATVVLLK